MLLFRRIWNILELWPRKEIVHFKLGLMDNPIRSMEDSVSEGDLKYEGLAQSASEEKNISKWPTDQTCDILVKNMTVFCPFQKIICLGLN